MLFDGYRVWYGKTTDIDLGYSFLKERMDNKESIIFVYEKDDTLLGFTQLYPIFSSVSAERSWLLNDLFVTDQARGQGVGKELLDYAKAFVIKKGHKGLALETGKTNPAARLYEREGWILDHEFKHYFWENKNR